MRTIVLPTAVFAALLCSPLFGWGQQPHPGYGLSDVLKSPGVAAELKLTDEQFSKATRASADLATKYQAEIANTKTLPPKERGKKASELIQAAVRDTNKAFEEILTPDQMKRLR